MKRMSSYLVAALCLLASCEEAPTEIIDNSPKYKGEMTVVYDGKDFEQEGINVQVEFNEEQTSVDIKLHKVKFVPAMPVTIDVTILDVPAVKSEDGTWSFYGDGITPWAMGGPYKNYRADQLSGTISGSVLDFSLDFHNVKKGESYPTSYTGTLSE
ncbi:MAG: hypothetical protein IJ495_04920 [Bacteroidales bacterium]|nr:hypothetical protein [Bacteroidales bacterium]